MYLKAYIQNFIKWPSGFYEKQVLISYVNDIGPRSRNDIDLETHIPFHLLN